MKTNLLILLFILLQLNYLKSQSHSTINEVKVGYKPVTSTNSVNPTSFMQCAPVATITLKSNINPSKIYLKILDKTDNTVIYDINYLLNQEPVYNQTGDILFKKEGSVVIIRANTIVGLKPYKYELATENDSNIKSENLILIK